MRVRIRFAKYGNLRFIGHLDVMRFFQKAIRRAGIDISYTTGFSPHQIMSFAQPLGLGISSCGEYMDIELNSQEDSEDLVRRLNSVCVPGIEIMNARLLPEDAGNAMASIAAAQYLIADKEDTAREDSVRGLFAWLPAFLSQEAVNVIKETKRGTAQVDLRPGIFALEAVSADPRGVPVWEQYGGVGRLALSMLVDASSAGNIKPSVLLQAIWEYAQAADPDGVGSGRELPLLRWQIIRTELYTRTGDGQLLPLDQVGEDF